MIYSQYIFMNIVRKQYLLINLLLFFLLYPFAHYLKKYLFVNIVLRNELLQRSLTKKKLSKKISLSISMKHKWNYSLKICCVLHINIIIFVINSHFTALCIVFFSQLNCSDSLKNNIFYNHHIF